MLRVLCMDISEQLTRYGLVFEDLDTHTQCRLEFGAPEVVEPIFLSMVRLPLEAKLSENLPRIQRLVQDVFSILVEGIMVTGDPPMINVSTRDYEHIRFVPEQNAIKMTPSFAAALVHSGDAKLKAKIPHEIGHSIQWQKQPAIYAVMEGVRNFRGGYGKGYFLDRSYLVQAEGFGQWCGFVNPNGELRGYQDLQSRLKSVPGDDFEEFMRALYDDPYSFGMLAYDLAEKYGSTPEVKKLAFESPKTREELRQYTKIVSKRLGLELPDVTPRPRMVHELTQHAPGREYVKARPALDSAIETMLRAGKEPKILLWLNDLKEEMLLSKLYWHVGVVDDNSNTALTKVRNNQRLNWTYPGEEMELLTSGSFNILAANPSFAARQALPRCRDLINVVLYRS